MQPLLGRGSVALDRCKNLVSPPKWPANLSRFRLIIGCLKREISYSTRQQTHPVVSYRIFPSPITPCCPIDKYSIGSSDRVGSYCVGDRRQPSARSGSFVVQRILVTRGPPWLGCKKLPDPIPPTADDGLDDGSPLFVELASWFSRFGGIGSSLHRILVYFGDEATWFCRPRIFGHKIRRPILGM